MKVFPMLLVLSAVAFVSCERHDWNETKKLHEPHEEHAEGPHAQGGEAAEHATEGEHAPAGEH